MDETASEAPRGLAPLRHGKFRFTPNGVEFSEEPTFDEWSEACHVGAIFARSVQMLVGDLLNYGEDRFAERASQVVDAEHWDADTVRVYQWVAKNVPFENRMLDRLSFKHHQIVAALPPKDQKRWLDQCLADGEGAWTTAKLKAAISQGSDTPEMATWLMVLPKDQPHRVHLKLLLEKEGALVKEQERRVREEKPEKKPKAKRAAAKRSKKVVQITARARNAGKRRGRSRG